MPSTSIGEAFEALLTDRAGQISVAVPAKVTSWNRTSETVAAMPLVLEVGGEARPSVPQCPVIFPGVYWDIQVGEIGMLIVCDTDFESWWRTGQSSEPATRQSHRIGNSVFIAGLRPKTTPRTHKASAAILDKPVALGEVLLGDPAATKAVVHQDAIQDILTWATAVAGAILALGGDIGTATSTLSTDLPKRVSPSVKVED